jgi:RNA polymerase sigma-54 factor
MSFLQLSTAELETTLLNELNSNPALELVEELRCPGCGKRLVRRPCPTCAAPRADDGPVVYLSPRERTFYHGAASAEDRAEQMEPPTQMALDEYILRQIALTLSKAERPVAAYLLARLDDDGLLPEATAEVANYLHVPIASVERVLGLIQRADPPGVGARTPGESLLIQLEALADANAAPPDVIALARITITDYFDLLAKHDWARLARQLHITAACAEAAGQFIQRNLTPYPGRAFWGDNTWGAPQQHADVYHEPDVNIALLNRTAGSPLMVEVFAPLSGWLRVNPALKAALAMGLTEGEANDREKWSQAVERAGLITKCLQQRNHTMRRLMEIIAIRQREFILGGDGDLHPLTRSQVAQALGVHESTISRAVSGKSVALPNGRIVPLARFFDRSLSVRDRVRAIVQAETCPLTDDEIAARLADEGVHVARRTVAKYRNMLGILPAHLRTRHMHN